MNWLMIIVVIFLAWNIVRGYRHGALRMIFSLISWILSIMLASYMAPALCDFIEKNTTLEEKIQQKIQENITIENINNLINNTNENNASSINNSAESIQENINNIIRIQNIIESADEINKSQNDIDTTTLEMTDQILESAGLYEKISLELARISIKIISFIIILIVLAVLSHVILFLIKGIENIPVIGTVNRIAGMILGTLRGLICIWSIFTIIQLLSYSLELKQINYWISESIFVQILYNINPIIKIIENII